MAVLPFVVFTQSAHAQFNQNLRGFGAFCVFVVLDDEVGPRDQDHDLDVAEMLKSAAINRGVRAETRASADCQSQVGRWVTVFVTRRPAVDGFVLLHYNLDAHYFTALIGEQFIRSPTIWSIGSAHVREVSESPFVVLAAPATLMFDMFLDAYIEANQ